MADKDDLAHVTTKESDEQLRRISGILAFIIKKIEENDNSTKQKFETIMSTLAHKEGKRKTEAFERHLVIKENEELKKRILTLERKLSYLETFIYTLREYKSNYDTPCKLACDLGELAEDYLKKYEITDLVFILNQDPAKKE